MREEGGNVLRDQCHGESHGGRREVRQGLLRSVHDFKRPCWLQTMQGCSTNKSGTSEPQFSALSNSSGTIAGFEVITRTPRVPV